MNTTMDFSKSDMRGLKSLQKDSPIAFNKGLEKASIQMLTWMNNGSPNSSRKPPIKWGVLRGSSTAFVGSKNVALGPQKIKAEADESPTPLTSYSGNPTTATFVYNTNYAAKMHEHQGEWGPATKQDGDAGNKWVEAHLNADKDSFMELVGIFVKKDLGL